MSHLLMKILLWKGHGEYLVKNIWQENLYITKFRSLCKGTYFIFNNNVVNHLAYLLQFFVNHITTCVVRTKALPLHVDDVYYFKRMLSLTYFHSMVPHAF